MIKMRPDIKFIGGEVVHGDGSPVAGVDEEGFSFPSFTETQRDALTLNDGDIIYNATSGSFEACIASSWQTQVVSAYGTGRFVVFVSAISILYNRGIVTRD